MGLLVGPGSHPEPSDPLAVLPRRVRRYGRVGEHGALGGEIVVGAVVGEVRFSPYLADDIDSFPEQLAVFLVLPGVGVGVELRTLVGPDTPAESDVNPAAGHVVEDGQVFGKANGVPPGGDVGHLPDAYPGGAGRQVCSQQDWVREVADSVGAEVVLSEPDGLETQFLGQDGLLSQVVQHVGGVGGLARGCRHGGECCEPHGGASAGLGCLPGLVVKRRVSHDTGRLFKRTALPRRCCRVA